MKKFAVKKEKNKNKSGGKKILFLRTHSLPSLTHHSRPFECKSVFDSVFAQTVCDASGFMFLSAILPLVTFGKRSLTLGKC